MYSIHTGRYRTPYHRDGSDIHRTKSAFRLVKIHSPTFDSLETVETAGVWIPINVAKESSIGSIPRPPFNVTASLAVFSDSRNASIASNSVHLSFSRKRRLVQLQFKVLTIFDILADPNGSRYIGLRQVRFFGVFCSSLSCRTNLGGERAYLFFDSNLGHQIKSLPVFVFVHQLPSS